MVYILDLAKTTSIYRFNNIQVLYMDIKSENHIQLNNLFEYVSKFTALKKLVISTESWSLLGEIKKMFPTLLLDVYFKERSYNLYPILYPEFSQYDCNITNSYILQSSRVFDSTSD
ncbi:hypothetical protein PPL_00603 [Heterostelium album PN500]|uniref:Uncharacterized protein n=1 Tax=Heterostelium pallidum (strain ATCC 26659 / Pp 5 / PN500) TaxID=670386 RepID=D3AWX5_HETP5|nr:hypothetical protein PPL_00603 [Heterostelium album PN500]EFA86798.1 hypothetical protein PPL_00603 [Heterostelium album PN500]|eukprot:XP_020438901.1 hypothetical protein PPL_00603 [Heterostelium album PN500]